MSTTMEDEIVSDSSPDTSSFEHTLLRALQKTVQRENGPNFDLSGCCDKFEWLFIILYIVYVLIIWVLWSNRTCGDILKPLKLFGVFVHEFSHASAAWLTCGKVKKIEVYNNEAGIAGFSGGWKPLIIPAGYVGGAFWGGAFVAMSGHRIAATVAGGLVCFSFLLALLHDPNRIVIYICVGFLVLTIGAILIDWLVIDPFIQYFTLFYGVFLGYYACRDIWDDCVSRDSDGSDSQECSKVFPCLRPKGWGWMFLIVSCSFQIVGLYLGLVLMLSTSWN